MSIETLAAKVASHSSASSEMGRGEPALALGRLVVGLEQGALGVAAHVERREREAVEERQRLARKRPPGQVAAEDDEIGVLVLELGEDGLERNRVPVDVREHRDTPGPGRHPSSLPAPVSVYQRFVAGRSVGSARIARAATQHRLREGRPRVQHGAPGATAADEPRLVQHGEVVGHVSGRATQAAGEARGARWDRRG